MSTLDDENQSRLDAAAERMLLAITAGSELLAMELGRRLGLYELLSSGTAMTSTAVAEAAGIAERYAREWLEQQAACGLLDVDDASAGSLERRFALPSALRPLVVEPEHPSFLLGAAPMLAGLALALPEVVDAYRSGAGVPYARFGAELRDGIAMFNRPAFANDLRSWIGAMPDVEERLMAGGTVVDVGCGIGWSTIALAAAFPTAVVIGIDMDPASIDQATRNAREYGVESRLRFELANATDALQTGADLVTVFEALHDMGEPIEALRGFRRALNPGGVVLIVDERVSHTFVAPAGDAERMQYAFSVLHCLPSTMAESTAIAAGTVLRAPTVHRWAEQAGFTSTEELPIENEVWRFYRLG